MAEVEAPKLDAAPVRKSRKGLMIIGAVLVAEAVGVFLVTNAFNAQPSSAEGAQDAGHEPADAHGTSDAAAEDGVAGHPHSNAGTAGAKSAHAPGGMLAEVTLAECRPSNRTSGRLITMQLRVSLLVAESDVETVKQLVEAKQARIQDRVNFVFRSAEPTFINEPGLETIKRRIKNEMDRVFGDAVMIHEILIPELLQSSSGA